VEGGLPCGSRLDVSRVGAARAGGLSLAGQEGLARARVGQTVLCCLLLLGDALEEDGRTEGYTLLIRCRPIIGLPDNRIRYS